MARNFRPSEGNFSKVFGTFADDDTAQYVFARFITHTFEGALIHLAFGVLVVAVEQVLKLLE